MDNNHTAESDGYQRGVLLYQQGRYAQAIDQLRPLASRQTLVGQVASYYCGLACRQLGTAALGDGRFEEAQHHIRDAMGHLGERADLASFLAGIYARGGQIEQCAAQAGKAADLATGSPAHQRTSALAQWQAGKRPEAILALSAAVRRFPLDASLHRQMGLFHAAQNESSFARRELSLAAELDGADVEARHQLALAAAAEGDMIDAARHLQRALELRPGDLLIAYQLSLAAAACAQAGRAVAIRLSDAATSSGTENRCRQLASFVAREPDFVDALLGLPPSGADKELLELVLSAVRMALSEHPRFADLHLHCGRILSRLGRAEEAADCIEVATAINPRFVRAQIELAKVLSSLDRTDEATAALDAAIAAGADWPDVHCLAGELLCRSGRRQQGRAHFERALLLKKGYQRAAKALESLAA